MAVTFLSVVTGCVAEVVYEASKDAGSPTDAAAPTPGAYYEPADSYEDPCLAGETVGPVGSAVVVPALCEQEPRFEAGDPATR